jgi:replicative DNA helicase
VQKQTLQTSSVIADALLGRGDALDCFNQNAQNAANINAYAGALQSMQSLNDNIQTTANNQAFADQQIAMGEKQIDLAEKKIATVTQQIDVVTGITDPLEKATHYKKVFGDCCDVPQSCCGGGCGCSCSETEPVTEP